MAVHLLRMNIKNILKSLESTLEIVIARHYTIPLSKEKKNERRVLPTLGRQ